MNPDSFDSSVISLFLPTNKLTKIRGGGYKIMGQYNNLSCHIFTQDEIDFLCDCYHSGSHSLIGVTNLHGQSRLTVTGITDRYKISVKQVRKWLRDYKKKMKLNDETANELFVEAPSKPCENIYNTSQCLSM